MDTPSQIYAEIARRVLIPGALGGCLEIGRPFGAKRAAIASASFSTEGFDGETVAALGEAHAAIGTSSFGETDDAVMRRLRKLAPADTMALETGMGSAVVRLGALFHDLVAAFHPDMAGLFRPNAPRRLLDATARALEEIPPPHSVRDALLRHAWLGELVRFRCARVDVKWWTGRASYIGREPPARLLAWPGLRRVHRDDTEVDVLRLPELLGKDAALLFDLHARAINAFLVATPLTDLVLAARVSPPFFYRPIHASLLGNPAGGRLVRRAVALADAGGKATLEAITAAYQAATS